MSEDGGTPGKGTPRQEVYWAAIERYERASKKWRDKARDIEKLYLYQDAELQTQARRFALLWSNVETLKPAVYSKLPTVQCSRRFRDADPVGRVASEVLERAINTTFELYGVGEAFELARLDRLVAGRGSVWVRYEADFASGDYGEELVHECVRVDHVPWREFGHSVARRWSDVKLVWRRVGMSRSEVSRRFGSKAAARLVYNDAAGSVGREDSGNGDRPEGAPEPAAQVYEIWDKERRLTVFLSHEMEEFVEAGAPPLNFREFWPCPRPILATCASNSLMPQPDYLFYRDQAKEINDLTDKIASLTDWLVLKGFIPGGPSSEGADAIERLLREQSNKAVLVQVESWSGFMDKGGAAQVQWLPLDQVLRALQGAVQARNQLVQDVYQITGISDILRGETNPNETLGAQELKAQSGARRIKTLRDDVARFCRDTAELVGEVIAEQFSPQTIAAMTGYKYVPGVAVGQLPPKMPEGAPQMPGRMPNQMPGQMPNGISPAPGQMPVQMPGTPPNGPFNEVFG